MKRRKKIPSAHSADDASMKLQKRSVSAASGEGGSMKRRKRAALKKSLHTLSKVESLTGGDCGHIDSTGTFSNKNLWDRTEFQLAKKKGVPTSVQAIPASLAALCSRECARGHAAAASRNMLQRLLLEVAKTNSPAPITAWERWQASAKLGEQLSSQQPSEWFLPKRLQQQNAGKAADDFGAQSLCEDLRQLPEVTEAGSREIASRLLRDSTERSQLIAKIGKKDKGKEVVLPIVKKCKHSLDIAYRNNKLLKLNIPHMEKLKQLYHVDPDQNADAFNVSLYLVLQRYHSLLGHGMQCACSEHVFDTLKQTLLVNFECFASPLNCRFPRYCSAFPDTDGVFGSLGSFFCCFGKVKKLLELFPEGGSFEANPPFIPRIMSEMVTCIERSLTAQETAHVALSFTVILPGWQEQSYWSKLTDKKNGLVKASVLIAASEHGFVAGAQHLRKERGVRRFGRATFDTAVFVLQNAAGAKKFPVPAAFDATVREAFRMALPTDAMRKRRMNEGRGFGDRDGGGGVYKGKTKKKKKNAEPAGRKGKKKGGGVRK